MKSGCLSVFSVFLIICFFNISYSQEYKWQQIIPIKSKLVDVETVLGKKEVTDHSIFYKLAEGEYYVKYSDGKCTTKWREEWNSPELPPLKEGTALIDWAVPEWTVLKVTFSPEDAIPVVKLGLDLKKLKKVHKGGDTDLFDYIDTRRGISYGVQFDDSLNADVVSFITVEPVAKYKNLLCK